MQIRCKKGYFRNLLITYWVVFSGGLVWNTVAPILNKKNKIDSAGRLLFCPAAKSLPHYQTFRAPAPRHHILKPSPAFSSKQPPSSLSNHSIRFFDTFEILFLFVHTCNP